MTAPRPLPDDPAWRHHRRTDEALHLPDARWWCALVGVAVVGAALGLALVLFGLAVASWVVGS